MTLVFPFASAISVTDLVAHIEMAVTGLEPFHVELRPPEAADGEYIFLDVGDGAQALGELHDRLYSGALTAHRSPTPPYRPHVTVGRVPGVDQLADAIDLARAALRGPVCATIEGVSVFQLDGPATGAVVATIPLTERNTARGE